MTFPPPLPLRLPSRRSRRISQRAVLSGTALIGLFASANAYGRGPYVTLRDDGILEAQYKDPTLVRKRIAKLYDATGAPRPQILSVWTSFPMGGNNIATYFNPASNDVTGIGLDQEFGGSGTFESDVRPIGSVLFHNNVTALAERAQKQGAPVEGFGEYLFLLELFHNWGPALRIGTDASADGGADAKAPSTQLLGFPFHWSFWMDAGGSPAGGNVWTNNGDGTFTVKGQSPATVSYSMLDLYLMGLADKSEVSPFGVLEHAVPPSDAKDPFGGAFSAHSFPWFGASPLTVTATRRTVTIDDVIATNGKRQPAVGASPTTWTLGIVLAVPADASDADVANAEAAFDPVAERLEPAFSRATHQRGKLKVVTQAAPSTFEDAGADAASVSATPSPSAGGCVVARPTTWLSSDEPTPHGGAWVVLAVLSGLGLSYRRFRSGADRGALS